MADTQLLLGLSFVLFALGLVGVMVRRNALVMLMCMELMLNAVILALVTFSLETATLSGAVLVFLIFVVAAAEIAIAIPIVLQLSRQRSSLDVEGYDRLQG
ncbi:MAG: NADH-quinone oxidoreductase subunit NuoK [Steroidobacteraceae bacterium]|jgi:NADH-quinone oxidoreductase subunit K|nr:NADH-quinone oxidoreductase subunit NuoK [Pseudomonadota bacterium]MBK7902649.1 NADH-quinone oxidoreductase subunit NuoK [Pseudomonadota bacterium]MBP7608266.1 NADH-quinone oxidoreductase subunit NuoK [Steroidobacteraceae bacterium]MBP9129163.1 NADH-quinone oxidoreductase subunit NuoK [Steroidobacteraceae bacterium]